MCLGAVGGLSIGIRVVLFKEGLLVGVFFVNWLIIALFALLHIGFILWQQRIGVVSFQIST